MPSSQFVIMSREPAPEGQMAPLGSRAELLESLSALNTSPERTGEDVLFGPGLELHLPPGQDPILQMLMTVSDHDIAWIAVQEIARKLRWKILDPQTGRDFAP
jgi:hypothetical protein